MSLAIARTVQEVRDHLSRFRHERRRIGLVPTMGALHAGHASLIQNARSGCDVVAVSIFVNPLQFGPNEDYQRYPRPLAHDLKVCEEKGADLVFVPDGKDIYTSEQLTFVEVARLGDYLCGPFRPGHFKGVTTVVAKLFNILQPDCAYFGEKDYQQFCIIRRMAQDLNLAIEIVPVPTYRDPDGLALSSRNAYLDAEDRVVAPILFRALSAARKMIGEGERDSVIVKESARRLFAAQPRVRLEYFDIVDPLEVQPVSEIVGEVRLAGAMWIGKTRLIDNVAAVPGSVSKRAG